MAKLTPQEAYHQRHAEDKMAIMAASVYVSASGDVRVAQSPNSAHRVAVMTLSRWCAHSHGDKDAEGVLSVYREATLTY